jgi:hypothetical protein
MLTITRASAAVAVMANGNSAIAVFADPKGPASTTESPPTMRIVDRATRKDRIDTRVNLVKH